MVDFLESHKIDILFTIGGDGTQKGALELVKEITKRNLKIAVVGIPKTIDNDLACTERTFGFETAVELAQHSINAAHEEARGARNGIGLGLLKQKQHTRTHSPTHPHTHTLSLSYCLTNSVSELQFNELSFFHS